MTPLDPPREPRVSDEQLADWHARWPSTLPTSVPHEQVRMLIEDLRDARAKLAAVEADLKGAEYDAGLERARADSYASQLLDAEEKAERLRAALHRIAYRPVRVPPNVVTIHEDIVLPARAALAESLPPEETPR